MGAVTTKKTASGKRYLYWTVWDAEHQRAKDTYIGPADDPDAQLKAKELKTKALVAKVEELKAELQAESPERIRAIFKYQSHGGRKLSMF